MSLAYVITAYKLPSQLARLMDVIWHPDDHFIIHVDAKTPSLMHRQFTEVARGRSNVLFIDPIRVVWAGFGICQAEWNARRILATRPGWTHLINLTGQDFPLRSREDMLAGLLARPQANWLRVLRLDENSDHFTRRSRWLCVEIAGKVRRLPIRYPSPSSFRNEWFGDGWHILTRDFCEWSLSSRVALDCLDWFRHVKHPHEAWTQAMIMASPFAGTVENDNRRHISWVAHSGNPRVLTRDDLPMLTASQAYFARKFDETVDAVVLEALASRLERVCAA